jgi:cytochrome c peroxidase
MNKRPGRILAIGAIAAIAAIAAFGVWKWRAADEAVVAGAAAFGLPPLQLPADVVLDRLRIELGRKLFFDRRLSFNGTMSCAMCHVPEEGFTSNASRTAVGIEGKSLKRNAPTLLNVAWQSTLFHDGRESSLSTQAWMPILHPDEMANPSIGYVLQRVRGMADYDGQFERAFRGVGPSMETFGAAIAAFEATLVSADSRFDRWRYGGQSGALNDMEQLGFRIFSGKGHCTVCHIIGEQHALLSDGKFHVTGAGFAPPAGRSFVVPLAPGVQTVLTDADLAAFAARVPPDLGRFEITLDPADRYAFKTPSLRNVAHSAPYMHDGSLATLEEVVDFYDLGGGDAPDKSATLSALGLGADEKRALVAFLRALDGANRPALSSNSRPLSLP